MIKLCAHSEKREKRNWDSWQEEIVRNTTNLVF
jgi:hypothetical protein